MCPRDGNLLAIGSEDGHLKIFDKRESEIVKTLHSILYGKNSLGCVCNS